MRIKNGPALRQIQAHCPAITFDIIHHLGHLFCTSLTVDGIRVDTSQIADGQYWQAVGGDEVTDCKFERFIAILRAAISCQ